MRPCVVLLHEEHARAIGVFNVKPLNTRARAEQVVLNVLGLYLFADFGVSRLDIRGLKIHGERAWFDAFGRNTGA